jgi:hypothetical protein
MRYAKDVEAIVLRTVFRGWKSFISFFEWASDRDYPIDSTEIYVLIRKAARPKALSFMYHVCSEVGARLKRVALF